MKLIICEKASLGKTVSKAIGVEKWEDGYIKCKNDYLVTWGKGHLFQLYDVADYEGRKIPWEEIPLPYIPEKYLYRIKDDSKTKQKDFEAEKQFNNIKNIIKNYDIDCVINCGDADREGQIIVDIIMNQLNWTGERKRLWLPEQTEQTIRRQLAKMEDDSKYRNLADEGYARSLMDWLLGINLSIYLKNKTGEKMNVGRVMIPIIKYIYDRDIAIKQFIKTIYYQAESITEKDGVKITLIKEQKYRNEKECEEFINSLPKIAVVSKIEKSEIKKMPKKLFSLSKLQSELSSKYKINFGTSNKIIQSLYEKGFVTYPRTNTEYLAEEEKNKVQEIIVTMKDIPLKIIDTKRIFDNSKIESHSAIIPTTKIPSVDDLSETEKTIYNTIKNRFISNFLDEETVVEKTTIFIHTGIEEFKLTGEVVIKEGFLKYEPEKIENQLPKLAEKEEIPTAFKIVEKETQPPKKVTEKELSNFLKNPFRKEKETEDEEYKAILNGVEIGTEATRTETIEKCKSLGYISQQGANYGIEPFGVKLIDVLNKLNINLYKEKTVEFSEMQKKVYKGTVVINDLLDLVKDELFTIINSNIEIEKIVKEDTREIIGTCPRCGRNIYESEKSFYCEGYKVEENICTFTLWKEQKYPQVKLTKSNAKAFLSGKTVHLKKLKSKEGKEYEADFILSDDGKYINLKRASVENKEIIGICPRCGRNIYESEKSFYCEGYKAEENKCSFSIWKEQKYPSVKLTKANVKALLSNKDILVKGLVSKAGKSYDAYHTLVDNGKYVSLKFTKFAENRKK